MSNLDEILSALSEHRDQLDSAINILSGIRKKPRPVGRPRKQKGVRPRLSAAGRKKLSDAAKAILRMCWTAERVRLPVIAVPPFRVALRLVFCPTQIVACDARHRAAGL